MKIYAANCLILFIYLSFIGNLTAQPEYLRNWAICPGVIPNESEIRSYETKLDFITQTVLIEVREPSCPNANDGLIRIKEVTLDYPDVHRIDNSLFFTIDLSKEYRPIRKVWHEWTNAAAGHYTVRGILRHSENVYFEITIELGKDLPDNFFLPIVRKRVQNESCPDEGDGLIKLLTQSHAATNAQIVWEDGLISDFVSGVLVRDFLTVGTYKFTIKWEYESNKYCCRMDSVKVGLNPCLIPIGTPSTTGGEVPAFWVVNPPSAAHGEGEMLVYTDPAIVSVPIEVETEEEVNQFTATIYTEGNVEAELADQFLNPVSERKSGNELDIIKLISDEIDLVHFYLDLFGDEGDSFTFIQIHYLRALYLDLEALLEFKKDDKLSSHRRQTFSQIACVGDIVYPGYSLSINGGVSPYEFRWAFDSDLIFDDADSLYHSLSFTTEGMHEFALLIEDFIGQRDTVYFEYDLVSRDTIYLHVPDLNIEATDFGSAIVCIDQAAFEVASNSDDATLTMDGPGLQGNVFTPSLAGLGEHYLTLTQDTCDISAVLVVIVLDQAIPEFNAPSIVTQCEEPIALNMFLTGDSLGRWFWNDTVPIYNDTLYPFLLPQGENSLSYVIGGGNCRFEASAPLMVLTPPLIVLGELPDSLNESDLPFDLYSLLDATSTLGGTWTGGNYVSGNQFIPSGLDPGFYTVTYVVGEGNCEIFLSFDIEIIMSTIVIDFSENISVEFYPSPVHEILTVCINEAEWNQGYKMSIYDLNGVLVKNISSTVKCNLLDVSELHSGLYLLNVIEINSGLKGTTKFIKE